MIPTFGEMLLCAASQQEQEDVLFFVSHATFESMPESLRKYSLPSALVKEGQTIVAKGEFAEYIKKARKEQ